MLSSISDFTQAVLSGSSQIPCFDPTCNDVHHAAGESAIVPAPRKGGNKKLSNIDKLDNLRILFFVDARYIVTSPEYMGSRHKYDFICDRGHYASMSLNKFKNGKQRCGECHRENHIKSIDEVRILFFGGAEYIVTSSEYKGVDHKYDFICDRDHYASMSLNNFKNGKQRCGECYRENHIKSIDEVRILFFVDARYIVTSSEYMGVNDKYDFICDRGHESSISINTFKSGVRCGECYRENNIKSIDELRILFFVDARYIVTSPEYMGVNDKYDFICDRGHYASMSLHKFKNGKQRCGECHRENQIKPIDEVRILFFDGAEYIVTSSEYKGVNYKYDFICDRGHEHSMTLSHFRDGRRCGLCATENYYSNPSNYPLSVYHSKIRSRLNKYIKKQCLNIHLDDLFNTDIIENIGVEISSIYEKCPQGHVVDHIVPYSFFNVIEEEELKACWSPDNLRYLTAKENGTRGNRMTDEEVEFMATNHPEIICMASLLPDRISNMVDRLI